MSFWYFKFRTNVSTKPNLSSTNSISASAVGWFLSNGQVQSHCGRSREGGRSRRIGIIERSRGTLGVVLETEMQMLRIGRYYRRPDDHSGYILRICSRRIRTLSLRIFQTGRPLFSAGSLRRRRRGLVRRSGVPYDRGERRAFLIPLDAQSWNYNAGGRRRDARRRLRSVQRRW